jgi:pimeloyl-ACP methyl ester carboxylesterase
MLTATTFVDNFYVDGVYIGRDGCRFWGVFRFLGTAGMLKETEMNVTIQTRGSLGSSHFVPTLLGKLHVVEVGAGSETIVLWPSIFTDHHIYDCLVQLLADRYRFLLVDGPSHGLSEPSSLEFTMSQCAIALETVLDAFNLNAAIVGGTSWGGLAAAELALLSPARVKAVILMNTPMEIDQRAPKISSKMIAAGARWLLSTSAFRNGVARSFFSESTLQSNPNYSRQFHDMLRSARGRSLASAVRSVILRGRPLKDRMRELSQPVLVIAGKDDPMYPIEGQAAAASLAPNAHFEPIEGKHISAVEQPQVVADSLRRFVQQHFAS